MSTTHLSQPLSHNLSKEIVWSKAQSLLKKNLSPAVFNTWILTNPLTDLSKDGPGYLATITCPTAFHATNLKRNLDEQIKMVLNDVVQSPVEINYVVGLIKSEKIKTKSRESNPQKRGKVRDGLDSSPRVEDLFSPRVINQSNQDRALWQARKIGLNPNFTFDTFAVSTTNEMAHAAAVAVSKNPGKSYNPLFFYGGVGVGKTHLMQAIGNNILKTKPETNIVYCTGEEFTNEIVQAIRTKRAGAFKQKYRSAEVLLIDDIQFIAGKNAVQEEFFHTFNALTQNYGQIVLTSDRPPHNISLLEDRLRSRFEAGLMIDIAQPTFELRTAIVLLKSKIAQLPLKIDLAKNIALKITSARKIEGFITKLRSEVELKQLPLTPELVYRLLNFETNVKEKARYSPSDVIKAVASFFKIRPIMLTGKKRLKNIVRARHLAMYILRKDLNLSLTEIGRWFGGKDHTSVMHAIKRIKIGLLDDYQLNEALNQIRSKLRA